MSNTNRTAYTGPPLSGPGIIWVNSVPKPGLDANTYNRWYQEVHIRDIISAKAASQGCIASWRFKCKDTSRRRPYLALYSIPDMAFIQSPEFSRISQHSDMLPEGGPSQKFIDFDTRFYRKLQVFEKPGESGIGKVVKSTAIQPAPGIQEEVDRWYCQEHLEEVSHMPGWRKSTRYELIFKVQSRDDSCPEEAPKYLAIHEFEEGTEVRSLRKEDWTDWTKKIVESAVKIDQGTFEYIWGTGADDAGL